MAKKFKIETLALHAGAAIDETMSRAIPVHRTSSYLFKSTQHAADLFHLKEFGNIYTRLMNPTHDVLEKRVAAMEKGEAALALASGLSAVFYSIINICKQGDEIIASKYIYGGTYSMFNTLLPDYGITTKFVDINSPDQINEAVNEKTRAIFTEVIGNPVLDVADIETIAKSAARHNLPLLVDSTFCTPYLFNPLEHGANVVIHSLTKWIGGHGTGIGGIVVDGGNFDWSNDRFELYNKPAASYHGLRFAHDLGELNKIAFIMRMRLVPLRTLGACISPDNAWMFLQGIETLHLRMERHSQNAAAVAGFLSKHPEVEWVRYPGLETDPSHPVAAKQFKRGFGGMVVFGIRGGRERGEKFINNLKLISHLANVGDAKSLAIHPAGTTHSQLSAEAQLQVGITPDLVRLSIGIEHIDDIIEDIEQAIAASAD